MLVITPKGNSVLWNGNYQVIDFNLPEVEAVSKLGVYILSNLLGPLDATIAY